MIEGKNICYKYKTDDREVSALKGVSFNVGKGEAVAILGRNGSGKSTLAKLINGLDFPSEGDIFVLGKNTKTADLWEIRRICGMVFQNPDSQIVASVVEEDIAFGLENIGADPSKMEEKIDNALKVVGMEGLKHSSTAALSGGQKQKLAIAGIFAMKPKCIILDEATSMLDPKGRSSVLSAVFKLREEYGVSVIMITHFINEACLCDKIYVLEGGKAALSGSPHEVLTKAERLKALGLDVPFSADIALRLGLEPKLLSLSRLAERVVSKYGKKEIKENINKEKTAETILRLEGVSYSYGENKAIEKIDFEVGEGSFTSIIGHTGSGKSTLLRTLNGLYKPSEGAIYYRGKNIDEIKGIRFKIGLVFQNPDYQLFEETVLKDVMFGALNMGLSPEEAENKAKAALLSVGFPLEKAESSPFELSGGEKKRASIAGILVMEPEILVLDEPAAGLDPQGRKEILQSVKAINKSGKTVVMVTHSMEDAAELSDYIIVLNEGKVFARGKPSEIFNENADLGKIGLDLPQICSFKSELSKRGLKLPVGVFSPEKACKMIKGN